MSIQSAHLLKHLRPLGTHRASAVSDAVLLGRYLHQRDEAAFAELVARYGPMVLRACRRVLADPDDAEDAFQATFLVLARKAACVRPPGALAAFLHEVARRVALKARAARLRRQQRELPSPAAEPPDPRSDPLAELSARELLAVLDEEVGRLPEVYRLPVLLCCVEGRTQEEAARQLGWSPGSLRGRLVRGRARLHARLVRRGLTLSAGLLALEVARGKSTAGSSRLVDSVLRLVRTSGAAEVSPRALALAEGVVRNMMLTKVKSTILVVLAGTVALGGILARHALAGCGPQLAAPVSHPAEERPPRVAPGRVPDLGAVLPVPDAWSKPLGTLCARLRIALAPEQDLVRHEATVEFINVSSVGVVDVSSRFRIQAHVFDDAGTESKGQDPAGGSAAVVPPQWVEVPPHAYVGFPADLRALGVEVASAAVRGGKGSKLALGDRVWFLKPGRYTVRAHLTIDRSEERRPGEVQPPQHQAEGQLDLPAVQFTVSGPQVGTGSVPQPPTPTFSPDLLPPPAGLLLTANSFDLDAGIEQRLIYPVQVKREGFQGPVSLRVEGLPAGVVVPDATIPADRDFANLNVHVSPAAPKGRTTATLTARGGGTQVQLLLMVNVDNRDRPTPPNPPHIALKVPARIEIEPGGACSIPVLFQFCGLGPIKFRVEGLPEGVRFTEVRVMEDRSADGPTFPGESAPGQARLGLKADASAAVGDREITIRATGSAGASRGAVTVRLRVAR
jgi:RNA polymerase sigma factor (sigma-70 family)